MPPRRTSNWPSRSSSSTPAAPASFDLPDPRQSAAGPGWSPWKGSMRWRRRERPGRRRGGDRRADAGRDGPPGRDGRGPAATFWPRTGCRTGSSGRTASGSKRRPRTRRCGRRSTWPGRPTSPGSTRRRSASGATGTRSAACTGSCARSSLTSCGRSRPTRECWSARRCSATAAWPPAGRARSAILRASWRRAWRSTGS